jgi:hypothetical protein
MKNITLGVFICASFLIGITAHAEEIDLTNSLVKTADSTAVYYVSEDGKRHAFPHQKVYKTWFKDFSLVQTITGTQLASLPLGKNILYRPGVRLVKVPSVSQVYAVEPFGKLRNLPSEEVAINLYGEDWSDQVDDIDISFFFDYSIVGSIETIDDFAVYPVGSLVAFNQKNYLMDQRSDGLRILRPITDSGWKDNNFKNLTLHTPGWSFLPLFLDLGPTVTASEPQFSCVFCSSATYARISVKETSLIEETDYSVEIPDSFGVNFGDIPGTFDSPMQIFETDFRASDDFIERIQLIYWPKTHYKDLAEFLDEQSLGANAIQYSGVSLSIPGASELVFETEDEHYRYVIYQSEDSYITIRLIADRQEFARYIDVFDLVLETLTFPLN